MYNKAKEINRVLEKVYGKNLKGEPIFRISFSDTQIEKRFGKFAEFSGPIFLREFCGLREVPKYPYLKAKYVLERWMPPSLAHTHEIPGTSEGSYEPVYVYQTADGEALSPIEIVAHKIIQQLFNPILPGDRQSRIKTEEDKFVAAEIDYNYEVLSDQGRSWIGHRLHSKEAIVVL